MLAGKVIDLLYLGLAVTGRAQLALATEMGSYTQNQKRWAGIYCSIMAVILPATAVN
jgi:hypothetical protein